MDDFTDIEIEYNVYLTRNGNPFYTIWTGDDYGEAVDEVRKAKEQYLPKDGDGLCIIETVKTVTVTTLYEDK